MSKHLRIFLFGSLLALMCLIPTAVAQDEEVERTGLRPDAPTYAIRGTYAVGTREFMIEDGDRILQGTAWYPALNPDDAEEAVDYDSGLGEILPPELNLFPGHALSEAEADLANAPYPLVIYSHSNGASRFWTTFYQEHLASYGFVVLAVDHAGTTAAEFIMLPDEEYFDVNSAEGHIHRPQDIVRILDYAETLTGDGATLEGVIDLDKVAVTGWSLGGYTAMAVAGARMDLNVLADWCAALDTFDALCNLLDNQERMAELAGLAAVPEGLWPSMRDPRVDAVITMATGSGSILGTEGLASVEIPVMMMGGNADLIVYFAEGGRFAYEHIMSAKKALIVFDHANHYIFGGGSPTWKTVAFDVLSDAVWDIDRAHDLTNHFSVAFLLAELEGDEAAAAALASDAVQFRGIDYETVGY
jgi:predicted dienelactone hydrolase